LLPVPCPKLCGVPLLPPEDLHLLELRFIPLSAILVSVYLGRVGLGRVALAIEVLVLALAPLELHVGDAGRCCCISFLPAVNPAIGDAAEVRVGLVGMGGRGGVSVGDEYGEVRFRCDRLVCPALFLPVPEAVAVQFIIEKNGTRIRHIGIVTKYIFFMKKKYIRTVYRRNHGINI